MKFEKEDFKKIRKVDAEEAQQSHERKLYSRKMTLFGPNPETWDLMDHTLRDVSREGRTDAVDAFEKELEKLDD